MTLSKEQREEIQKTLAAAIPSHVKWKVFGNVGTGERIVTDMAEEEICHVYEKANYKDTAHFIANAPEWIRLLLASEQAWKEENTKLKSREATFENIRKLVESQNNQLKEQLTQAVKVIQHYADEANYEQYGMGVVALEDRGEIARDFLSSLPQESEGRT